MTTLTLKYNTGSIILVFILLADLNVQYIINLIKRRKGYYIMLIYIYANKRFSLNSLSVRLGLIGSI